jgi:hypothetical protein
MSDDTQLDMTDSNPDGFWDRELSGLEPSERQQAQDAYERGALQGGTRSMLGGPREEIAAHSLDDLRPGRRRKASEREQDREAGE